MTAIIIVLLLLALACGFASRTLIKRANGEGDGGMGDGLFGLIFGAAAAMFVTGAGGYPLFIWLGLAPLWAGVLTAVVAFCVAVVCVFFYWLATCIGVTD